MGVSMMAPKHKCLLLALLMLHSITSNANTPEDIIQSVSVSIDGEINAINTDNSDDTIQSIDINNRRSKVRMVKGIKTNAPTQHPIAMGIVLKNPRPYPIRYYWWSGTHSVYQGPIGPRSVTATNSYVGHEFYFTSMDKRTKEETEFFRVHIVANVNQYILPPEPGKEDDPHYIALMKEKQFVTEYIDRTGYPWLAHYPRHPPIHHMWPASFIGQTHTIVTNETYWTCVPELYPKTGPSTKDLEKCHRSSLNNENLEIKLEVISKEPRAFLIMNTLSDAECDLIMELAKPKIKRSRAGQDGGSETNTRTSSNTWLGRKNHYILDTIYRRAAAIMNISESLFHPGAKNNIVEDM